MQGTVASYDDATRSGTVFLDDGTRLRFDRRAMESTELRFLRPGQRVRLETEGGAVTRVQILTLP
jgi:2-phospho-L-lactate guanylyltransferase